MSGAYGAVLFDMDGLMLDTERIYMHAQRDAAARLGFEASDDLLLSFVGVSGSESLRRMQEAAGDGFPMDKYKVLWYEIWRETVEQEGIPLKQGLPEMLAWLSDAGVPTAVVTSTHRGDAELSLRGAGIRERFEHVVSGDQVAENKPAPDIYLRGAAKLGVDPAHCIALEDSDAGVLSAAAAGMRVVMVPDLRWPSQEARAAAYAVAPSLVEALPMLQEWLGDEQQ